MGSHLRLAWLATLLAVMAAGPRLAADDRRPDLSADELERRQAETDARIAQLIEQLGAAEYPRREKAKNELARLGLAAFDALHEAQFHRDLEIGMQARYLVRSAQVAWVRDDDPPEVKSILRGYGVELQPKERATRIERIALLENRRGWDALLRLARFEIDEPLSKQAALALMSQAPPQAEHTAAVAKALQLGAAQSRRRAAQWLRTYARSLQEPETVLPEWTRLVNEEFDLLRTEERKTSPEVVTALARWHVETLVRLHHESEATDVVNRLTRSLDGTQEKLLEHVEWLAHREMWSHIIETSHQFEPAFNKEGESWTSMLLYRLAEAQRRLGDEAAAATAAKALAINGVSAEARRRTGYNLGKRGLFDWAEAEYREVFKNEDLVSPEHVWSRSLLAEMLHDLEKDREAAEVLSPVVKEIDAEETDENGKKRGNAMREMIATRLGRDPEGIKSRMHYFAALEHLKQGDEPKAVNELNRGAAADPTDADVIIALYRLENPTQEQRETTSRLIREATASFQDQVTQLQQLIPTLQGRQESEIKRALATAHNQLAWLVSNTEGDYEAAVAASHESLKLNPGEPAYLDTLGRCYYAVGDLTNAIKYQTEAVRKEPYSGQMQRQLALFKREAEKRNEEK